MSSQYPAIIDSIITLPLVEDNVTAVSAEVANRLREAIIRIEAELGVKPSSIYTTVRGRLDLLESQMATGLSLPTLTYNSSAVLVEDGVGGVLFRQLYQADILPDFDINSFTVNTPAQPYERGETVSLGSAPQAAATYVSGTPDSASITTTYSGSSSGSDVAMGAWTLNTPFASGSNASASIKRCGADGGADPVATITLSATKDLINKTSATTMTWTRRIYWRLGTVGGGETVNEAFILASPGSIGSTGGQSVRANRLLDFTVTPNDQYVYHIIPTDYGTATFTLNGFPVPFSIVDTINVTNTYGVINEYKVARSDNKLTGTDLNILIG